MADINNHTPLPEEFKKRSRALFDNEEEFGRFLSSLEEGDAVRALRINTLKVSDAAAKRLITSMGLVPLGYGSGYIFESAAPGSMPMHHAGAFYVQDPGAMSTVAAAESVISPDLRILDMCASPGGKSTQLAALLTNGGSGYLVSNEIDRSRAKILRGNTERMGHRRTVVTSAAPDRIAEDFESVFDFVLADAPCSGEGMMRKYAEASAQWSEENVLMCAERQRGILEAAQRCVCGGGYLMYSTCTFSLEENEMQVDDFLTRHPDFELIAADEKIRKITLGGINFEGCKHDMSACRRFYPHVSPGEGQFFALMKKSGDTAERSQRLPKSAAVPLTKDDAAALDAFLSPLLDEYPKAVKLGGSIMLSGDLPCPAYTLCCGVCAGEVSKSRLVPAHHLFSAMGSIMKNTVDFEPDSPQTEKYLRGETVETEKKAFGGWCAVTVDGCAAGGGKLVEKTLKNHYPKGLRNK